MSKFYYFQTTVIENRGRLRPMPFQTIEGTGEHIDTTRNVQADTLMRGKYPIGTIFGSDNIKVVNNGGVSFYSADGIVPVACTEKIQPKDRPSQAMADDYIAYNGALIATRKEDAARAAARAAVNAAASQPSIFDTQQTEESQEKPKAKRKTAAKSESAPVLEKPDDSLSALMSDKSLQPPTLIHDGFYIADDDWWYLVSNIKRGVNTMMIGHSGTGKTELVMLACKKMGIDCSVFDMGSMYDPISGLLGVHRLKKGGESVFDYAAFTQAIQKPGVVLLDELSRAPVTTNNILFPCLDSRRELPVAIAGGDDVRNVKVHPKCVFIATANVGVEYTGTMSMDRALVGRFLPLELNYLDAATEKSLLMARCGILEGEASLIATTASVIRSLYEKEELSCTVSTRETIEAAKLVAFGWSPLTAMQRIFLPLFRGTFTEGERGTVTKIFMTK